MKKGKISLVTWIIVAVAIIVTVASLFVAFGSRATVVRNLSMGNKFLSEMDYENAIIAYNAAVVIEPNNKEALEGLMQIYKTTENYEALEGILLTYVEVAFSDGAEQEEIDVINSMVRASYDGYDSAEQYAEFVKKVCDKSGSSELDDLRKEGYYALAAELMEKGEFEAANEIIDKILKEFPDDNITAIKANVLQKCAEIAWKKRDFETAFEYLKQALEYAKDNKAIKDELLRVIEDYATQCKNNQDYDRANELIAWLRELRGDQCLQDIAEEIAEMERADADLQVIIEKLNGLFEADDITAIQETMLANDFVSAASRIKRVLFCNSLRDSKGNGHGTAIYNVGGTPFVYYGDYVNGKREGSGLWYTTNDKYANLDKYTLTWKNDLPNGEGTLDNYQEVTNHSGIYVIGRSKTHMQNTFVTINGVYDGTYACKWLDGNGTHYNIIMHNGYEERIEWENVPRDIKECYTYPTALAGYYAGAGGYYAWRGWSPNQQKVDGLGTLSSSKYQEKGVELEVE